MADKYDDLQPDSNLARLPGWGRGSATPAPLMPKWAGQFDTHDAWVATATARLVGAVGSVGQDVPAICVDAKGRRCNVGRDFARARDEGAFPVRYFWECEPVGTELLENAQYTAEAVRVHAAVFPVPSHMRSHADDLDALRKRLGA